jgi:hypothetical protein
MLGKISRKMKDVLARAACDFKDCASHRQDIVNDIQSEIAIAYCRRRVLAVIGHLPHTFNAALASLTPRAFVAEVCDSVRGVYGTASLSHYCHCRNATSRDVTTTFSLNRLGVALQ